MLIHNGFGFQRASLGMVDCTSPVPINPIGVSRIRKNAKRSNPNVPMIPRGAFGVAWMGVASNESTCAMAWPNARTKRMKAWAASFLIMTRIARPGLANAMFLVERATNLVPCFVPWMNLRIRIVDNAKSRTCGDVITASVSNKNWCKMATFIAWTAPMKIWVSHSLTLWVRYQPLIFYLHYYRPFDVVDFPPYHCCIRSQRNGTIIRVSNTER